MRLIFLTCIGFLFSYSTYSQPKDTWLDKRINITLSDERLDESLKKIAQAAGFTFSYNASLLERDKKINYQFQNKTIREILDTIFDGSMQYKQRGKYIILTKASRPTSTSKDVKLLSGYVIDEGTGKRLQNVSVYDPATLASTVTDSSGYFQLEIKKPSGEDIRLAINKRDYADTLVVVSSSTSGFLDIPLRINKEKINKVMDSVTSKLKRAWFKTKEATRQAINMENISDTIYRRAQFSFLPFIGSNGKLSGNVINDYSLNVHGGYSLGVRKLEIGSMFNLIRGDLGGVQFAGLFNGVFGKNRGVQFAGLANVTGDSSLGPQVAGLVNSNFTSAKGLQLAGLANYTEGSSHGWMFSGLSNFTLGEQKGPHVAGLFNFVTHDTGPAHLAGLFNFTAGSHHGIQVAGLFNYADEQVRGAQLAGLFNVSPKYIKGIQVAPFNFAKRVEGAQIGVVNISKSIRGVPLGLISIVGDGYHKIEISADEVFYTNIAFRTGVRQFYNILTAGANPATFDQDTTLWTFGYGIGTAPKISDGLSLNFDITSNQVVYGNKIEAINLLNKFYAGVDIRLAKNLSITTGITLNAHITKLSHDDYPVLFADYSPDIFYERNLGSDHYVELWWGGKIGIRFL